MKININKKNIYFGVIKNKVFVNNPKIIQELKDTREETNSPGSDILPRKG